ncbi:MAG: hypothetical protein MHM6MM_005180 [Cercozoa sp. M6MM]
MIACAGVCKLHCSSIAHTAVSSAKAAPRLVDACRKRIVFALAFLQRQMQLTEVYGTAEATVTFVGCTIGGEVQVTSASQLVEESKIDELNKIMLQNPVTGSERSQDSREQAGGDSVSGMSRLRNRITGKRDETRSFMRSQMEKAFDRIHEEIEKTRVDFKQAGLDGDIFAGFSFGGAGFEIEVLVKTPSDPRVGACQEQSPASD